MNETHNVQLGHADHVASGIRYPLTLLVHDITDASNVGGLFRLSDALGVERIFLSGNTITPPDKKLARVSRSTDKAVAYSCCHDPLDAINTLRSESYTILALELSITSHDINDLCLPDGSKICLVIGNEKHGVSEQLLDACDQAVHIPMLGQNSSMNVTTATAIACWELARQLSSL